MGTLRLETVDAGAQLDLQDDEGYTALMDASGEGHTEIAVALISAGGQLDLQNDDGCTAMPHRVRTSTRCKRPAGLAE